MSMESLVSLESISPQVLGASDYVVFGGTFDPIHEGHVQVVKSLAAVFPLSVVAPTTLNPWKKDEPQPAPFGLRVQMAIKVLSAEGLPMTGDLSSSGVHVCSHEYVYAAELVEHLRAHRHGVLYWAVGEDISLTVPQWRNWHELGVRTVVVPVIVNRHSTEIRTGQATPHPALSNFIAEHGLYNT